MKRAGKFNVKQRKRVCSNKAKFHAFEGKRIAWWHVMFLPCNWNSASGAMFSSLAQSCPTLCDPMNYSRPSLPVHHQPPELAQTPVYQVGDAISSSVVPFSSCLQSFLASGSFPMSQLFASCSQSIGASASATVLPMNIQGWFPVGLTGVISLLSKGLTGIFSSTTVQKHLIFDTQPSLWSSLHICTRLLEKP